MVAERKPEGFIQGREVQPQRGQIILFPTLPSDIIKGEGTTFYFKAPMTEVNVKLSQGQNVPIENIYGALGGIEPRSRSTQTNQDPSKLVDADEATLERYQAEFRRIETIQDELASQVTAPRSRAR